MVLSPVICLFLDNQISRPTSNSSILIQTLNRNLLQLLTGTLQTTAILRAKMLADNSNAESHGNVIESSVPNFVGEGSLLGVEEAAFGEEKVGVVVHADVHADLWRMREKMMMRS